MQQQSSLDALLWQQHSPTPVQHSAALEGMTRQPEMAGTLFTNMLVAIGLIESIPIIAIVIAIVLVFANPFLG